MNANRRAFLIRTAVLSALAGAGMGAGIGIAGATPGKGHGRPAVGYTLGSAAPDFAWNDQYGRKWQLRDFQGSWTLVDFTALWCPPCNVALAQMPNLLSFLEDHGIALQVVELLVEGQFPSTSATPREAEIWATRGGDPGMVVLHPDGPNDTSMLDMMSAYYTANGLPCPPGPWFPNFVLLDKDGIVRYVVPSGTDMDTYDVNNFTPIVDAINPSLGEVSILAGSFHLGRAPFDESVLLQAAIASSGLPKAAIKRAGALLDQVQTSMAKRRFDKAADKAKDAANLLSAAGADVSIQDRADGIAVALDGYLP
jgi:thiol-disulfide isomerase/thioredoxin